MKAKRGLSLNQPIYDSKECMEVVETVQNHAKTQYAEALYHLQYVVDSLVIEMNDSLSCDAYKTYEEDYDDGSKTEIITEKFDAQLHDDLLTIIQDALENARSALTEYKNIQGVLAVNDMRDTDEYLDDEGTYLAPDEEEIDDDEEYDEDFYRCQDDDYDEGRHKKRTRFKRCAD